MKRLFSVHDNKNRTAEKEGNEMQQDTVHLLQDCSAGITMALATIDGILPNVKDQTLRQKLKDSVSTHHRIQEETRAMLASLGGQDKAPGAMAKGMSWLVTNAKMALGDDTTAAYLVADGCDMGVKSLCRSRNRYPAAEKDAKQIAESLIDCEEELSASMRPFL